VCSSDLSLTGEKGSSTGSARLRRTRGSLGSRSRDASTSDLQGAEETALGSSNSSSNTRARPPPVSAVAEEPSTSFLGDMFGFGPISLSFYLLSLVIVAIFAFVVGLRLEPPSWMASESNHQPFATSDRLSEQLGAIVVALQRQKQVSDAVLQILGVEGGEDSLLESATSGEL